MVTADTRWFADLGLACLTRYWFASLREAQSELSTWRADYNNL
jgi:hypothetical protein